MRAFDCREERGQAAVELVAVVPAALAAMLLVWQLALAGYAAWSSANAARVAARAEAVGRDGRKAARSALPRGLERGLRYERDERRRRVRVRLRVPLALTGRRSPLSVGATASLEPVAP